MLYEIKDDKLYRFRSKWQPRELDIEKYLVSSNDDHKVLDASVFGEPLYIVSNQVKTKFKKRADILAIDRYGNGVIIELKRDKGRLGVEMQALQYLADFSSYKGRDFIKKFSKENRKIEEEIASFVGADASINDINKTSRIILLARDFDPSIFSMGEWLSNNGVPFRCIQYEPIEIEGKHFISFSIAFDRSKDILNPLAFVATAREPGYYWHNIAKADPEWWSFLIQNSQIPACFDSMPGDEGEKILKNYIVGDKIIAYATGYGAVGWGVIEKPNTYHLVKKGSAEDRLNGECLHRVSIRWKAVAKKMDEGISATTVRNDFGIYHPIRTSVSIEPWKAERLIHEMNVKFGKFS